MVGIKITGIREIESNLNKIIKGTVEKEEKALLEAGELLKKEMQKEVNVSGKKQKHIRDDIKVSTVKEDEYGIKEISVGPGKETGWRAKFLEYGTSKMTAKPFMEKAYRNVKDQIKKKIEGVYKI
ncbi:MAG: hypothetical protein A2Y24_06865 [Clostridiales bacterium GWE2_32_10]|nr:MAG: hypothetical protein A2Y24_06865 [Clostridiales bacterium GWE2_32_10]